MHKTQNVNKFLQRNGTKILPVIAVSIILFLAANTKLPNTETLHMLGYMLPIWSILPFVGILLSIAFIPHVNHHFWERHRYCKLDWDDRRQHAAYTYASQSEQMA